MQALTFLCNSIYYNHKILVITYISELSKLNWGAFHNCLHKSGFILERSLAGFLQLRKKCQIKFTLPRQMGHRQNRPKNKIFFEVKVSKTSLTTTLIWRPLYKLSLNFYSLSLSQLLFSSSFESLFHQTNIWDYAEIRAQAFSVAQNVPKWRQSVRRVRPM